MLLHRGTVPACAHSNSSAAVGFVITSSYIAREKPRADGVSRQNTKLLCNTLTQAGETTPPERQGNKSPLERCDRLLHRTKVNPTRSQRPFLVTTWPRGAPALRWPASRALGRLRYSVFCQLPTQIVPPVKPVQLQAHLSLKGRLGFRVLPAPYSLAHPPCAKHTRVFCCRSSFRAGDFRSRNATRLKGSCGEASGLCRRGQWPLTPVHSFHSVGAGQQPLVIIGLVR